MNVTAPSRDDTRRVTRSQARRKWLASGAGLVLGGLLALAFPPYGLPWLGLLAIPALLRAALELSPGESAGLGLGAGLSFFGIYLRWLGILGWYALAGAAFVQALFFAAFFWAVPFITRRRCILSAFAVGGLWGASENLRGAIPFGGFPWGTLGSSLHDLAGSRRLASVIGTSGLSILIVVASCLLVWTVTKRRPEAPSTTGGRLLSGFLVALFAGMAVLTPARASSGGRTVTIALVQGGIERPWYAPADPRQVLDRHIALTRTLKGRAPDLVLWGEGVIEGEPAAALLPPLAREIGAPIAAGAVEEARSGGWLNLVVASDGRGVFGRYAKQRPVPFGEYVPLRRLLGGVPVLAKEIPQDMRRGSAPALFDYGFIRATPVISFESTFPSIARRAVLQGAGLLQVHTNNSSYGRSSASSQHLALDQMRAAELGVPVARSAITGISAVIDAGGRVVARMEIFQTGVLISRVEVPSGSTPYRRFGDLLLTVPLEAWGIGYLIGRGLSRANRKLMDSAA